MLESHKFITFDRNRQNFIDIWTKQRISQKKGNLRIIERKKKSSWIYRITTNEWDSEYQNSLNMRVWRIKEHSDWPLSDLSRQLLKVKDLGTWSRGFKGRKERDNRWNWTASEFPAKPTFKNSIKIYKIQHFINKYMEWEERKRLSQGEGERSRERERSVYKSRQGSCRKVWTKWTRPCYW